MLRHLNSQICFLLTEKKKTRPDHLYFGQDKKKFEMFVFFWRWALSMMSARHSSFESTRQTQVYALF